MAAAKIAVLLAVVSSLLLLSGATRLSLLADETPSTTVDAPKEAEGKEKNVSVISLDALVQDFRHADRSFRRPGHVFRGDRFHHHGHHLGFGLRFPGGHHHRRHHHHHGGHRFHGGEFMPYSDGMVQPKSESKEEKTEPVELAEAEAEATQGSEVAEEKVNEWDPAAKWKEAAGRLNEWKSKNKEHKKKMKKKVKEADSDSDSDDEEFEKKEKKELKKKEKRKKGRWFRRFSSFWEF